MPKTKKSFSFRFKQANLKVNTVRYDLIFLLVLFLDCVLRRQHVLFYFVALSATIQAVQILKNLHVEKKTLESKNIYKPLTPDYVWICVRGKIASAFVFILVSVVLHKQQHSFKAARLLSIL